MTTEDTTTIEEEELPPPDEGPSFESTVALLVNLAGRARYNSEADQEAVWSLLLEVQADLGVEDVVPPLKVPPQLGPSA